MRTRLEHGTDTLESKVFRNADVKAIRKYLRSWRVDIKNEPRERRLLDDCRLAWHLNDNFALDHDFALDHHRRRVWHEHDARHAVPASIGSR